MRYHYLTLKKEVDVSETCLLQIALRNMKSIEVRVVGSVVPPKLDISMVSVFQLSLVNQSVTNLQLIAEMKRLQKCFSSVISFHSFGCC